MARPLAGTEGAFVGRRASRSFFHPAFSCGRSASEAHAPCAGGLQRARPIAELSGGFRHGSRSIPNLVTSLKADHCRRAGASASSYRHWSDDRHWPRPDRVKGLYRATRAPRRELSLRDKAGLLCVDPRLGLEHLNLPKRDCQQVLRAFQRAVSSAKGGPLRFAM